MPEISDEEEEDEEEENVIFDLGGNATMRALHLDIYEYLVYHAGIENGFVAGQPEIINGTFVSSAPAQPLRLGLGAH